MTDITSLAVFCGSRVGGDPAHGAAAERLGRELAARGIRLVYGGGGIGLMAVVADAALKAGGRVTGVIPDFLVRLEVGNVEGTEVVVVGSMHERKARMFQMADAFVVLPGGLGTLDETIEITTWKQLQQHAKPIVLVDVNGYWQPFLGLIDRVVDGGYGHHKVRQLFSVVPDVDGVFDAIAAAPPPDREVLTSHL
jgi:uncharacterized protein (TIGR00730 family)